MFGSIKEQLLTVLFAVLALVTFYGAGIEL